MMWISAGHFDTKSGWRERSMSSPRKESSASSSTSVSHSLSLDLRPNSYVAAYNILFSGENKQKEGGRGE